MVAALALPSSVRQNLFTDTNHAASALAERVAGALRSALSARGQATLIVSGGRTPAPFQEALSQYELDWSRVTVSLADDRWVTDDHPDSNARLVRRHLLINRAATARFVPLVNTQLAPGQQRAAAEQAIARLPRPFDAVLLGMGEDGHIASLFPDAAETPAALDPACPEQVVLVTPTQAPHRRISLTLAALLDTRVLVLLIQGEHKRATILRAVGGTPRQYPVSALLQQNGAPLELYYSP